MKTFLNKKTSIDPNKAVDYFELATSSLNVTPKGGLTISLMNDRLKVINKLVGEKAELEDSEYLTLKNCLDDMRWVIVNPEIVEFVEYINNL